MTRAWMPLYIADYLAETAHLDAAQSGAYLHLIMHYWQHGALPTEDRVLARIARIDPRQWRRIRPIVSAFFAIASDGRWSHARTDLELARALEISTKRKAAAEQMHRNGSANRRANGEQMHADARTCARASQPQPQPQPLSLSGMNPQDSSRKELEDSSWKESNEQDPAPPDEARRSRCAFEAGIIRLNAGNLEKWRRAFPNLSLESELIGLAAWAAQQTNWFIAVSGALAKKQREAVLALERIKAQASLQAPGSTYVDPRL